MSRQHHYLKILPEYYRAIENGDKTFEVRYNDRNYQKYDILHLQEWINGVYTKREIEAETDESSEKKESKFKKKKEKKDKKDEQIEALTDQVKRQMAEFENFRRRTEIEKSAMFATGAKSVLEKILPVVDSFERGLVNVKEGDDPISDGMLAIYRQLMTSLTEAGLTPIEAEGCQFNPDFHNAVMQVASEGLESGMVAQELQKGYMYRDTVVRHSMVSVVE